MSIMKLARKPPRRNDKTSSVSITLDRYGHLMPGSEDEAAGLLDACLCAQHAKAEDRARAGVT